MDESVLEFYDDLAEAYHLIFADWKHAIAWQGEVLSKIIQSKHPSPGGAAATPVGLLLRDRYAGNRIGPTRI